MIHKLLLTMVRNLKVVATSLFTAHCSLLIAAFSLLIASPSFAAISTVDPEGGAYSSIKLQSDGKPAVAYFDHKTGELRYSYWTGTQWLRTVLEEKGAQGYVSLWLDNGNKPYISYYHNISKNNSTGSDINGKYGNHMVGALKYAYCATTTCLTPEDWTKVTVAQIGQSENGHTGGFSSLVFDSSGNPRIAYYDYSHKVDVNDIKKGALKLAYCNSGCNNTANWSISTVDTDGGRSASMVIDGSNKVMLSYDADEVKKIRYAEASSPFSLWTKVDIVTITNPSTLSPSNLFMDTSIAINSSGKPRLVYQSQTDADYGHSTTVGWPDQDQPGWKHRRDINYAYCDAVDCTVSTNWTKVSLAAANSYFYGYTSSIKVRSDGIPRIAYHYWGHTIAGGTYAAYASPAQDLYLFSCGNSGCSSGNTNAEIDSTNNTGLYSSITLDSSNNPLISYYDYTSNQLKLYHPTNSYTGQGITADVRASDNQTTVQSGLQSGDSFTILFSGATNGAACSITTANIDTILKLSNGHSWVCSGSSITAQWSSTYNTNDTLKITITSGTGGCVPTVEVGDRVSLDGTCILDGSGNPIILQTEIKGSTGAKVPTGAIAYYKMDEGSKLTAYDSAGGNNASLNNGVTWITGAEGSGVSLDGSNDHLFAPGVPDIGGGKLTIEAWLKPNAFSTGKTVLSKENSYVLTSNGQCAINTPGTSWVDGEDWYGEGSMSRLQRNYSGNKDIWRQIVCTYDSATGLQKVYIDGILDGTMSASGDVSKDSRYPFVMGRRELSTWPTGRGNYDDGGCPGIVDYPDSSCDGENYWGRYYYNGKMDEVVLYNTALTETEILARFSSLPAQLERADAHDTSGNAYGLQTGDTVQIRFTNGTNAPTINSGNINTVLAVSGKTWLDGSGNIGSAVWTQTRFTNDTLLITLSTATSTPTIVPGDIITLSGGVIKEKTGLNSITGSTKIRGSYDLNGAVAYWNLDESSGNPSDSVGQYNTGTLKYSTTASTYSTGKFNNAINFDGGTNSQYVEVSNYSDLNPTNISVEAWAKSSGSTWNANGTIVSKRNAYILYPVSASNNMRFYIYAGGSWQSVLFTADTSFDITQWHHYVGTYDGTNLKIYVDGVLKNTSTPTGSINTSDTGVLTIGRDDGQAAYLDGSIDEVVIYNRAITADEVRKRNSAKLKYAVAKDAQGTPQAGIQTGDKVIIIFDAPTGATSITSANIGTALALSNGHSWLDGNGAIVTANWSATNYTNDTLTITLSTGTSVPTVAVGDTISLSSGTLKDAFNRALEGSIVVGGNFGDNFPADRIAYWNFDEQSGGTAHDSIGNNHGTPNNSFWKTERLFKGLYFDGSRYVDVPDSPDFDLSSYTIDTWVKVPDGLTTGTRRIISQDDGTNYWKLQLNNNTLELCDSRLTTPCNNTATTINDGEWHHVAVVHDDAADTVKLYIDGVALVTNTTATGGGTAHNINTNIQLGRKSDSTEYFYGLIDELAIYNRALDITEIQSRYRAPAKVAFTSDIYFNSGIQAGDKVIIRFHGKTNGYTPIDNSNINTILQLSSGSWLDGAGQIGSAVWTQTRFTNDTLTITLSATTSAPTIGTGATITINGTYIKDIFNNAISDSATLSKDFDFNLPDDAVAYYKLENNNDSFGQNNIAANTGTLNACKFNNCYYFGNNQYIQINNSYLLNPERLTVEGWVYSGAATWAATNNSQFFYGGSSVRFMGIASSTTVRLRVSTDGTNWTNLDFTPSNISGWHHYAGTYDGTNLKLYVDGVEKASTPLSGVIYQFDTGSFYIGAAGTGYNPGTYIDDVTIYNRALTAEEVMGRYGDYNITALAMDTSTGGAGIQAGDTVEIKFSGPTNAATIDATNIENTLPLSNAHYWKNGSGNITTAVWSTRNYSNDTLTISLANVVSSLPDVAPGDTITVGLPIGSRYRAFTKSGTIAGSFGNNLPSVMAAYWTFDEQSGGTAYDSIGENHGTLNNSFWRTERTFKGLYFDGSRYVDVPDRDDFNLSSYTIDAWVKVPDGLTTGVRQIISQDDGANYWRFRLNDNRLELCDSRLSTPCNNTATTINDGEWHHVAVVRDDSDTGGTANSVLFYIDGVNIWTVSSLTETGTHAINANIQLGRKYDGTEYFYGFIDELAVYSRVLTQDEIRSRYRAPIKVAFTSDIYFESGIQQAKDKVIIRFHGKTNGYTVTSGNIGTVLPLSGGHTWGTIQSADWSSYKFTNDTLTVTLGTGADIAKGDTLTINSTYIKDLYGNDIYGSITLNGDFNLNLPEGAVSYYRFDETSGTTASDSFNGNSGTNYGSPYSLATPVFSYDFAGTTITNLTYGGTTSGFISQNNYLSIRNNAAAWDTYVYTNATFARSQTKAFQASFQTASSTAAMIGWHDGGTGASYTDLIYAIYFNNGTFYIYEDGTSRGSFGTYSNGTWYDIRIELKATGAKYYYKLQSSSTWTLLYDSNYSSEATLRPGVAHNSTTYSYTDNWVVEGTTTVTCPFSNCYSFGSATVGNDQYVSVNNSFSLNPERLTIETWVKNNYGSTWNGDSYFFSGGNSAQLYGTNGVRTVNFRVYVNGGWRTVSYTPSDISIWHQYVGTYDGTSVKLYMDGVLVGTTAYTGVINQFDTNTFYLGATGTGYAPYISIDDMVIYSRALTLEEVLGRYGQYITSPFYITAFADDPAPDVSGIQAGDTVEIRFPGPTNGAAIDAATIDNFLTLSNLHSWRNDSGDITSAEWSTRVYTNDTLTITLANVSGGLPDVAPQDTISMGGVGEINAKYRASTYSAKISGTFGEPLPPTPVAFWKMDENIGTTAFDSVGTNHGTLSGTTIPAWKDQAMFNSGLDFNSSTAYMSVPSIDLSVDWSIEGWFKYPLPSTATYNSLTGDRRVVVQRTDMHLGTHNGSNFVDLDTTYVMSGLTSGWHHIAAVGSGSDTIFYIDGVLVGTAVGYKTTAALTTIGNTTAGSEQFGLIDELAVYSSALTADDVASRYLVFLKEIYAKDTSNGGAGIQDGDQVIVRFDGPTGATPIDATNIDTALQLSSSHSWKDGAGNIGSAVWSTTYKTYDTLTITLSTGTSVPTVAMRDTITLGAIIKDAYGKDITGSMQIGGDFGTNLPDGAVAYYKFDDGTIGSTPATASDSFNDYDGALTNTPTWTTAGRFNNALQFTGGTGTDADYVEVSNATVLNPGKLTVEAWAKSGAASWNTNGTIVSKRDAYILYPVSASKNMRFYIYAGGAWQNVLWTADGSFDITKWHHYVGTYDGTNIKIYVDGVLKNTQPYTGSISTTDTGNIFIGRDDGTANYLNGSMDEVILYNRALTLAEIRTRYGAGFASATADDNSNKGPNIQANDRVIITFTGETNGPTINAGNINTVLALNSAHSWLDGSGAIVSAVWDSVTYPNDALTITLSGPATYVGTTPTKPTVVVGDTLTINGTITDSSSRVIRDNIVISGSFGVTAATMNTAAADDNSGRGPNIQANDRVVITFSGATNAPSIDATNINTILPVSGKTWLDGNGAIGSAVWSSGDTVLTITLSGPATYADTTPAKPTVVVGDTISINGTMTDPSGKAIVSSRVITGSFGTASSVIPNTAAANDNSGKGPNIQANDRVVITFSGATNAPTINAGNINTVLALNSAHSWRDGNNAIVTANWSQTTNPNDTLTITLSGPATYIDTTPAKPTVVVGDTISIDGTITDSTGKAIIGSRIITGSFGTASSVILNTAVADDNSGKGPNIQANDRVVITFSGATNAPSIDATNINTILPVSGKTWLDGNGAIVTTNWSQTTNPNDTLTITLSGPATYVGTTPAKPTVVVGDTISIDGTITDSSGKAIISSRAIGGNFGDASSVTLSTADADDNSGKGPNIQANDRVVITFSGGATNAPSIDATNINTILPVIGSNFSYDFAGTTIDTAKLDYGGGGTITQNGYLSIKNNNDAWDTYVYTDATFNRSSPNAFQASFQTQSGARAMIGWHDGGTGASYTDLIYAIYFNNGTFSIYEDGTIRTCSLCTTYSNGTWYDIRIELKSTGAKYYYKLQSSSTWTLLYDSSYSSDTPLRPGVAHYDVAEYSYTDNWVVGGSMSWLDGDGAIGGANWTSGNTVLTVTLSGPATYSDTTPAKPTVAVGGMLTIDGTIADSSGKAIVSNIAITGSFGTTSPVTPSSAVADDNSNWGPNIQANDRVVITFSGGATNAPTIDATNIDTVLKVSGKTWKDGNGAIGSAVWSSGDTVLTITLSGPPTQPESSPASPTIAAGDTIIIDGTMADTSSNLIISSVPITGSFGTASGTVMSSAIAFDDSGKYGINAGDKVTIIFNGQIGATGDTPPTIDAGNINTVLALNNGHSWLDGSGNIGSATWNSPTNTILTVTLSNTTSAPSIAPGDTITLGGSVIKDRYRTLISSSKAISGDFAIPYGAKAWWKLNETSGAPVADSIGSNGGTITDSGGSSTTWTTGRFSNGLYLDGSTSTGDYVTLTSQYNLTSNWTIEAWFKWPISQVITNQQKHTLISSDSASDEDQIIIENQTKFLGTSNGNNYYYVPNYDLKNLTSGWHHIAAVGTGGSGIAGTTQFYIDGNSVGMAAYKSQSSIKRIGNSYVGGLYNRPMTNTIDNIVLYDTDLSATAIKNRYGSWPRSAFAYGTAGDYAGITTGDQVIIRFDQATEGNTINASNIGTALQLSGGHTWLDGSGNIGSAAWSQTIYSNDTLTITLSTTSGIPSVDENDTITLNNVINDHAGRPISDQIVLQGNFDFKLPLGAIAYWRFNEGSGVTVNDSFGTNHANLPATVVDTFDTTESWTEVLGSGSVVSGWYNFAITTVTDPYFSKNITDFEESYDYLEFTYKGYGGSGPSSLKVYYTDGVDCTAWNETCAQSFTLIRDSSQHTIYVQITDPEWVDNDGIITNLRFDLDGATVTGTFKVDSIKFGTVLGTNMWDNAMYGTKGVTVDSNTESVALNSPLNMPNEWTIIGWVKTPIYGTMDNALIHSSDGHEHAICIHTGTGKAEVGNVSPASDPGGNLERGTGYFLNRSLKNGWHQIAAVGTGGNGTAGTTRYYVDGQDIGEAVNYYSGGDGSKYKAFTPIGALGNNTGAGVHAIGTTIDEISIYDRPLSATEIRQHYGARLIYARAKDTQSSNKFGIDSGDQVVLKFDGETSVTTPITVDNIDTVLKLSNGHSWKDGNDQIGSIVWSPSTYTNDTLTITLSTNFTPPTITTRDTITLDGVTIKDLNRVITGSIDISGDFDGSVAYYDLDDGAAVTATDSINGNNGTLSGQSSTLPAWVSGYSGSALDFNDTNTQYVTIPDSDNFNLTSYTIEAWLKLPTTLPSNYMRIVSQESNTNPTNYWSLAINPSGQLVHCDSLSSLTEMTNLGNPPPYPAGQYDMGGLPSGQNPKCETVTTKDLRDEKWHFVSVVRDINANQFRFFIDHGNCTPNCAPDKTVTGAGTVEHNIAGTVELGRKNGYQYNNTSYEYFRGLIDNVAIYNYAMSDAEVNAHHFLFPSEAHASNTSGSGTSGIQAGDTVTILFNGETGATTINSGNINSALKLITSDTWGTIQSAVWSQTYYPNDTLKVILGSGAIMAIGNTITLGNIILDVHSNAIIGSVNITGSFDIDSLIGTIAYWTFDEGLNDTVGDSVGSYSGTRYNGLGTWITTGKFGSALDFTGTTGYVSLTNAVQLSSYNEWTIESWFYAPLPINGDNKNTLITDTNTQHIIVGDGTGRYLGVYSTADGLGFRSSGYSGMDGLATGWHHLVAVGKNSKTYFYIDGFPVGTYSNYKPTASISKLGNGRNGAGDFLRPFGKIDDVVIYKRVLSTSEITARALR